MSDENEEDEPSDEDEDEASITFFFVFIYTLVVIVMSGYACYLLFYYSNRLRENPPEILINALGANIIVSSPRLQDESVLWVRIIAVLYGIMCFLAVCSLFSLPKTIKSENSCSCLFWLVTHGLIDILAIAAILLSHFRNFENIWKILPIPFLVVGMFIWILVDAQYRRTDDDSEDDDPGEPPGDDAVVDLDVDRGEDSSDDTKEYDFDPDAKHEREEKIDDVNVTVLKPEL